MVILLIFQFLNNDWKHLGNAQIANKALAMDYIDELEEKLSDPNVTHSPQFNSRCCEIQNPRIAHPLVSSLKRMGVDSSHSFYLKKGGINDIHLTQ